MNSGLDINGCLLSYFEGTANLHCYTSCTLTTLHRSKVSFLQCCHMKTCNKIFQGCTHCCEILCICMCIHIFATNKPSCTWASVGGLAVAGGLTCAANGGRFPPNVSLVFCDELLAQGLHLKSHQRCSAAFCRPVKFFHTDWIIISLWFLSYTQRHCHVRIEKGPVQTVDIKLEVHNSLEYHFA